MDELTEDVYLSLLGALVPEAQLPWVENAFEVGKPCYQNYSRMLDACEHLYDRLGVVDEDADVQMIVNSLLSIQNELCRKMFHYGLHYRELAE